MKNNNFILSKNHLPYWLRQMRKKMELIGPLRDKDDIVFKTVDNIHEITMDAPASLPTPKEYLFPQLEPMYTINIECKATEKINAQMRVIFGLRSCDISAMLVADKFFLGGIKDPYYGNRRNNIMTISIACNKPDPTCFCNGLNTGPFLRSGFDIQLYDLGDRYFLQCGSKKATEWISGYRFIMSAPSKADYEDQYEVELSSQAMFQKRISLQSAREIILSGAIKDDFWRQVTERCFQCGGCVYECPLCTCFSAIDRKASSGVERLRFWDTCFFKGFTKMAGGVVLTDDRILRTKRWYYHKLIYYPELYGSFGCVGCGRCTIACPAVIDMATITSRMKTNE